MNLKIAVASSDGKVINAHFGRTPQFLIFEVTNDGYSFLELRKNLPGCSNLNNPTGSMDDTIDLISDCDYVFCSQIGPGMINRLASVNIIGVSCPNFIENELESFILKNKREIN